MSGDINETFNIDKTTEDTSKVISTKNDDKISCSDTCNCKHIYKYYLNDTDDIESNFYLIEDNVLFTKKHNKLPPIGVFWDIENCRIPRGCSAMSVAQLIREEFFNGHWEAEFIVVCDVTKENCFSIQELSDAQITLIHVPSRCKNAADEKLRQSMRKFADTYGSPSTVILISGDINFAADVCDLNYKRKIHVILLHLDNCSEALIMCASEHYNYAQLTCLLPRRSSIEQNLYEPIVLLVSNLPHTLPPGKKAGHVRLKLRTISDICGGKIMYLSIYTGTALIRFTSYTAAERAQKRLDGEYIYGSKISVGFPGSSRTWEKGFAAHRFTGRRVMKSQEMYQAPNHPMYGVQNNSMHYSFDYYNQLPSLPPPNYMDQSSGAIPKSNHDYFNPYEQMKKNFQPNTYQKNKIYEGIQYIPKPSIEYTPDIWNQSNSSFTEKRCRSSSDSLNKVPSWSGNKMTGSYNALNVIGTEDNENQFQGAVGGIVRSNSLSNSSTSSISPVELLVTNIDQTMDPQELKRILLSMFKEHVMVVSLNLFHQSDGNLAASVKVSSAQDAQYVISQLHRRKVGHKRVIISNAQTTSPNPHLLRSQVINLLQEVPGNRMPLFKFRELLESRYRTSVSVSELYKLRDVCTVNDELGGRMVTLVSEYCTTSARFGFNMGLEVPHCIIHCPNGIGERGWAEPEMPALPNIRYKLKVFTSKVHSLLHSHMGILPLPSFAVCYEEEIGEKLYIDESGVPLEHLVTCVVGVELRLGQNMVKYIGWDVNAGQDEPNAAEDSMNSTKCVSPPLVTQLALFSRELVDLLKTAPHCQLPFSRFIPAYHHHFGRQCRVADYGYTKLVDLFDALSHVVQIIGEGNKRFITLSHSAQVRRFTSDLLRVLKSQVSKQVMLSEFPLAYERVLSRPFDPVDYGLCDIEDLLEEVSENTIVVKSIGNDIYIAIPKKEQTSEEIMRTKQFATEVVDLLRHAPQYSMLFNKFVPAYHHHYGHQCRVSDYGFTKLIELFEAIPDVVKIEETPDNERKVSLVALEALKVVCEQITTLVKSSRLGQIPLVSLPSTFLREHGYALRPEYYECESVDEIIHKLSHALQLVTSVAGPAVVVVEESTQELLGIRLWGLLLNYPYSMTVDNFLQAFQNKYGQTCDLQQCEKHQNIVLLDKNQNGEIEIKLTNRYVVAAKLYHLLYELGGTILLGNLDGMYLRMCNELLRPADFGAASLNTLLGQFPMIFIIRGRRQKKSVTLNPNLISFGIPLPENMKDGANRSLNETNNNTLQWPPPPAHTFLYNSGKTTISPPKPDTPPTNGRGSVWDAPWNTSLSFMNTENLCIPLPPVQMSSLLSDATNLLISPAKNLLPACNEPPDPSHLPMPNADLLSKAKLASPSRDSGISSTSITNSMEEVDTSNSFENENKLTPTKKKRLIRLAAQFANPLNLM